MRGDARIRRLAAAEIGRHGPLTAAELGDASGGPGGADGAACSERPRPRRGRRTRSWSRSSGRPAGAARCAAGAATRDRASASTSAPAAWCRPGSRRPHPRPVDSTGPGTGRRCGAATRPAWAGPGRPRRCAARESGSAAAISRVLLRPTATGTAAKCCRRSARPRIARGAACPRAGPGRRASSRTGKWRMPGVLAGLDHRAASGRARPPGGRHGRRAAHQPRHRRAVGEVEPGVVQRAISSASGAARARSPCTPPGRSSRPARLAPAPAPRCVADSSHRRSNRRPAPCPVVGPGRRVQSARYESSSATVGSSLLRSRSDTCCSIQWYVRWPGRPPARSPAPTPAPHAAGCCRSCARARPAGRRCAPARSRCRRCCATRRAMSLIEISRSWPRFSGSG